MTQTERRDADTICACNHWFEEHDDDGCECGCKTFELEPEYNTPTYIAGRGGEHQDGCVCALCVYVARFAE